jgi:hypothetical protein
VYPSVHGVQLVADPGGPAPTTGQGRQALFPKGHEKNRGGRLALYIVLTPSRRNHRRGPRPRLRLYRGGLCAGRVAVRPRGAFVAPLRAVVATVAATTGHQVPALAQALVARKGAKLGAGDTPGPVDVRAAAAAGAALLCA